MIDESQQENSDDSDLDQLSRRVAAFVADRDWTRFHSAKNLAMALSVEASELLEIFQWSTQAESDAPDRARRQRAPEEIADVQIYLLQIAARLEIDIGEAVVDKLAKNARKYPAS